MSEFRICPVVPTCLVSTHDPFRSHTQMYVHARTEVPHTTDFQSCSSQMLPFVPLVHFRSLTAPYNLSLFCKDERIMTSPFPFSSCSSPHCDKWLGQTRCSWAGLSAHFGHGLHNVLLETKTVDCDISLGHLMWLFCLVPAPTTAGTYMQHLVEFDSWCLHCSFH